MALINGETPPLNRYTQVAFQEVAKREAKPALIATTAVAALAWTALVALSLAHTGISLTAIYCLSAAPGAVALLGGAALAIKAHSLLKNMRSIEGLLVSATKSDRLARGLSTLDEAKKDIALLPTAYRERLSLFARETEHSIDHRIRREIGEANALLSGVNAYKALTVLQTALVGSPFAENLAIQNLLTESLPQKYVLAIEETLLESSALSDHAKAHAKLLALLKTIEEQVVVQGAAKENLLRQGRDAIVARARSAIEQISSTADPLQCIGELISVAKALASSPLAEEAPILLLFKQTAKKLIRDLSFSPHSIEAHRCLEQLKKNLKDNYLLSNQDIKSQLDNSIYLLALSSEVLPATTQKEAKESAGDRVSQASHLLCAIRNWTATTTATSKDLPQLQDAIDALYPRAEINALYPATKRRTHLREEILSAMEALSLELDSLVSGIDFDRSYGPAELEPFVNRNRQVILDTVEESRTLGRHKFNLATQRARQELTTLLIDAYRIPQTTLEMKARRAEHIEWIIDALNS